MSITGLFNQTLTNYPRDGFNPDGSEKYTTGVTEKCRFQSKQKRILLPNGQFFSIDATAYVAKTSTIVTDSRVSIYDNFYKVVSMYQVPGGDGAVHHIKLELVKWQ